MSELIKTSYSCYVVAYVKKIKVYGGHSPDFCTGIELLSVHSNGELPGWNLGGVFIAFGV